MNGYCFSTFVNCQTLHMFRNTTVITQQITMDLSFRFNNVLVWEEGKGEGRKEMGKKGGDKRMEGMTGTRFKAGTGKKKRK